MVLRRKSGQVQSGPAGLRGTPPSSALLATTLTAAMERRKFLVIATLSMCFLGIFLVSIVFIGSLVPSEKAIAALPRFDISELEAGKLSLLSGPTLGEYSRGYEMRLLSYKSSSGKIKVWEVPVKDGRIGMPDLRWYLPEYACANFKIVRDADKAIIACQDQETSEWWAKQWMWTLDGNNIEGMVDNLQPARGKIEGKYFVYDR